MTTATRARARHLGLEPGLQLQGGPMLYLADRPEPGLVVLKRFFVGEGPTLYSRAGPRTGEFRQGFPLHHNPYSGQSGWTLYALGTVAHAERGLPGQDDATKLRKVYSRLPTRCRTALPPKGMVLPGDPLQSPGQWGRWVSDECIRTLIEGGVRQGLQFAVPPSQTTNVPGMGKSRINPIAEMQSVWNTGQRVDLHSTFNITLKTAAAALGFEDLHKPISAAPEKVYEKWRSRSQRANPKQRLLLNAAYHRILLHRFLRRRRLTPTIKGARTIAKEIERRACLIQAYRVFVFDRRGCPVGLNMALLRQNNLEVKTILNRKIPHAGFTRSDQKRVREFGAWLYTEVLNKALTECRPESIAGLAELLAAAEQLR